MRAGRETIHKCKSYISVRVAGSHASPAAQLRLAPVTPRRLGQKKPGMVLRFRYGGYERRRWGQEGNSARPAPQWGRALSARPPRCTATRARPTRTAAGGAAANGVCGVWPDFCALGESRERRTYHWGKITNKRLEGGSRVWGSSNQVSEVVAVERVSSRWEYM